MCRSNMQKKEKDITAINKFPIVEEPKNPNIANGPHILCKTCLLTFKGDLMRLTRSGEIPSNSKTAPLKCAVCVKKVHQVEMKYIKTMMKSEGGCCSIL